MLLATRIRSSVFWTARSPARLMSGVVDKKMKAPDRSWLTTDNGMDALLKYEMENFPIVTLGESYLAVKNNGDTSWGAGLPKGLDDKLRGRQKTLPTVNLLELGPDDSYYVQFEDGTSQWSVSNKYLWGFLQASQSVTFLAVGVDGDSYYVKNSAGCGMYQNLPKGLEDALTGRKNSLPGVSNVNMGPNGEWFVRFEDGSWSCHGMSGTCDEAIDEIKEQGYTIQEIQFGKDFSWMIRYFDTSSRLVPCL